MLLVVTITFTVYCIYLLSLLYIFRGVKNNYKASSSEQNLPKVSIIIAARNEEKTILYCLQSIYQSNLEKLAYEVIVVNDHSSDNTLAILQNADFPNLTILDATGSGKKAAISQAVKIANGSIIGCTDADCIVSPNWIEDCVAYIQDNKLDIATGIVKYQKGSTTLDRFQYFDNINSMAVTASGINNQSFYLANGANFWYKKSVFEELNGYTRNYSLQSGDDVFLIQEAAKAGRYKIGFLAGREMFVTTSSEKSISAFLQQRKRWASKTSKYPQKNIVLIQAIAFTYSFLILLLTPAIIKLHFIGTLLFVAAILLKVLTDYAYLKNVSKKLNIEFDSEKLGICSILYVPFILWSGIIASRPRSYIWKGRRVT